MRYLQTQVKDLGLPEFVNQLTPVVEVAWSSPASKPNQDEHAVPVRRRRQLHGRQLCAERRGADPRQQADRLACRRDRAVPSLLRRPVPQQSRQTDRGLVPLMRLAISLLVLAMLSIGIAGLRACACWNAPVPPVGSEVTAPPRADRPDLHRGRGTAVQHDRTARCRRHRRCPRASRSRRRATTGSLPSICRRLPAGDLHRDLARHLGGYPQDRG